jgi:hypothetical protein
MTQSSIDLHILVGEPRLFGPTSVEVAELLRALGPRLRLAPMGWMGERETPPGHDVLLDGGDRRVAVMARSLSAEFGGTTEPCLILPSLASEARREAACAMIEALSAELRRQGDAVHVRLHGVALADGADPRPILEAIRADLAGRGIPADLAEGDPLRVTSEGAAGQAMRRNLLAAALADEVVAQAAELGLRASEPERLAQACAESLAAWAEAGLVPAAAAGSEPFRRLAATLLHRLLAPVLIPAVAAADRS